MRSFCFLAFLCFRVGRLSRCCIELLGVLQGIPRELVSLLAEFVSGSMICFAVGDCCDGVGVEMPDCEVLRLGRANSEACEFPLLCRMQTIRPELQRIDRRWPAGDPVSRGAPRQSGCRPSRSTRRNDPECQDRRADRCRWGTRHWRRSRRVLAASSGVNTGSAER
jgi:hypothetical protein